MIYCFEQGGNMFPFPAQAKKSFTSDVEGLSFKMVIPE